MLVGGNPEMLPLKFSTYTLDNVKMTASMQPSNKINFKQTSEKTPPDPLD